MSNISKRRKEGSRAKIKSMGDHKEFLKRITKTLYYGQLPSLPCLSLPVTEVSCAAWSAAHRGRSLRRLHADAAAGIARSACVSPCALVLAVLYLERLRARNPHYLEATSPADLFLVSLMVGNKFLQDDGEDDEVVCSEWASSGGLELKQLKKLEVEFLDAIDWNIFVSDKSFEAGLCWLEREVALKQAQLHGFFTYSDLVAAAAAGDATLLTAIGAAGAACAAAALAYLAGLLALLAPALLVAQTGLPALHHLATAPIAALHTNIVTHSFQTDLTSADYVPNSTAPLLPAHSTPEPVHTDNIKCCTNWLRYQERDASKTWHDNLLTYDRKAFDSKTSVLNWLYRSSLINPMQRWLERINEYADYLRQELGIEPAKHIERCEEYVGYGTSQRCARQWLQPGKLGALIASAADR